MRTLFGHGTSAATLLRAGDIDAADAAARAALTASGDDREAVRVAATVALWRNRVEEAFRLLQGPLAARPRDGRLAALYAEACRRAGRVGEAADAFTRSGRPARARQLASFGDAVPLRIDRPTARLPLVQVDPLPLVDVAVEGRRVLALVDTGAADLIVDRALARQLGLPDYGREGGAFVPGRTIDYSRVASVRLGEADVRDAPAALLDVRAMLPPLDGRPLEAIVGTTLLSRFGGGVLDYGAGSLALGPPDAVPAPDGIRLPFWLVDDHIIVTRGRLNADRERLVSIDTGVGGAAFIGPDAVLRAAGVPVPRRRLFAGAVPRTCPLDRLAVGPAQRRGLQAFAGLFPAGLPGALGLALDGLVGHEFLRAFRLALDFTRMQLTLAPA